MKTRRPELQALLLGILRLLGFNEAGFATIDASKAGFLRSLAPLIAFTLVGGGVAFAVSGWHDGLWQGLQTLCVALGQPVVSHFYAARFGRSGHWLRFATAMNWCQVAMPAVGVLLLALGAGLGQAGLSMALGLVLGYAVLLNWFLIWRGLALSGGKAALFLVAVTFTIGLLMAPAMALRLFALQAHPSTGVML